VIALQYGPQNGKDGNENNGPFKRYQTATHGCTDAICGIVGTDIPADIGSGSQ
jgi:hypothetical protein